MIFDVFINDTNADEGEVINRSRSETRILFSTIELSRNSKLVTFQADKIVDLLKVFVRKKLNATKNSILMKFSSSVCMTSLTVSKCQCFKD